MGSSFERAARALILTFVFASAAAAPLDAQSAVRIVSGVGADGAATELWLAVLRRRLGDAEYDSAASIRRQLQPEEAAWAKLIADHARAWEGYTSGVAAPYAPVRPPDTTLVVLGNRGASDAFTHDERTIGFDLAALQAEYGDAASPENVERIDRFFRHEFAHVVQKAWLKEHPYPTDTELRFALVEIWKEGLGNYLSLSDRWRREGPEDSEAAAQRRAVLEPRFVARMAAIACAQPEQAAALKADLSWGRFDRKWGALVPALWLEAEPGDATDALRAFVRAGPDGVLDLAVRHLPEPLAATVEEIRTADRICRS